VPILSEKEVLGRPLFRDLDFDPPNPVSTETRFGGLKLSSELTFHQVHKSGYSEVPPRQPANRIFLKHQEFARHEKRVGLEIPFIHVTN
jgi:hypothetical protein